MLQFVSSHGSCLSRTYWEPACCLDQPLVLLWHTPVTSTGVNQMQNTFQKSISTLLFTLNFKSCGHHSDVTAKLWKWWLSYGCPYCVSTACAVGSFYTGVWCLRWISASKVWKCKFSHSRKQMTVPLIFRGGQSMPLFFIRHLMVWNWDMISFFCSWATDFTLNRNKKWKTLFTEEVLISIFFLHSIQ